jgi:hypothetical protein
LNIKMNFWVLPKMIIEKNETCTKEKKKRKNRQVNDVIQYAAEKGRSQKNVHWINGEMMVKRKS